jgi:hypothetical protein
MKRIFLLPLLSLLLMACHSLPPLVPAEQAPLDMATVCAAAFPHHAWRMVHTITMDLPGRRKGVMLGVVSLSPASGTIECALLSIEGLRLFEARDDGSITTRRALPPFDRPALAEGMMQDIRLLFFSPPGEPIATGLNPSGNPACRYDLTDGFLDVIQTPEGSYLLERYDRGQRLIRRAEIRQCRPAGAEGKEPVPCRIHLEAMGANAYRLDLDLVEARPVLDESANRY